ETIGNGQISFGRALAVGLLITAIASVCYVVSWEIISHTYLSDFADKYMAQAAAKIRASGKPPEQITQEIEQMQTLMNLYKSNIFVNIAMTLLEPLPVGLVMTLISALILRKRRQASTDYPDLQDLQDRPNPV